ncbi:ATP-binding protein [Agromyces sp. MMS24-JH15]|uniref:ATP-binding protein n=1 Tax=Agromyces sp. MMS24-JH15 TaxID=3243765 RepID=UPI00374A4EB5
MSPPHGSIRTPDQRLRVFVSSTLRELATERRAVRAAIEELRLAPVMFELGARPHPPRELYRAYLEQSDIFVGLYAERYGWVAPGEEISGLEDEWRLAPADMPKLVYVKEGGEREPRLVELLDKIRDSDGAAYVYFADADELAELVRGDLATLLAERFQGAATVADLVGDTAAPRGKATPPPVALAPIIGRERELGAVVGLIRGSARLVTLTGPGGIGKSRLAIEAAAAVESDFPDGVAFVDLASVRDAAHVPIAIGGALGIHDTGAGGWDQKVRVALRDRRMLLIIDNFEQVIEAASEIGSLIADSPTVTFLVTSRTMLRVSGEHGIEVGPLPLPDPGRLADRPAELQAASVRLFVDRVRAVKPDFELNVANAADVARICVALDGVPLAIELAAARARVLSPGELLDRLHRRLPVLEGGRRDLPERQRTMRSAIEWSVHLLPDPARELFARLGAFAGPFSIDAVEAVAGDIVGLDVVDTLGLLVDGSLVHQQDRRDRAVFTMLGAVREVAHEMLLERPDATAVLERQARWFIALSEEAEIALEGAAQPFWIARLVDDAENLRAVARNLLDSGRYDLAAWFAWKLFLYWWVGGHLGEVRGWMSEVLDSGVELDEMTHAIALYFTRAIAFWQNPDESLAADLRVSAEEFERAGDLSGTGLALISLGMVLVSVANPPDPVEAMAVLERSADAFREADDTWGVGLALVTIGRIELIGGRVDQALARFEESLDLARRRGDRHSESIAQYHRGWAYLLMDRVDHAAGCFESNLALSYRLEHDEGIAYGLEGLTAVAADAGDAERAGLLLGASEVLRERTGLYNEPTFSVTARFIEPIVRGPDSLVFEAARGRGRTLTAAQALSVALGDAGPDAGGGGPGGGAARSTTGAAAAPSGAGRGGPDGFEG